MGNDVALPTGQMVDVAELIPARDMSRRARVVQPVGTYVGFIRSMYFHQSGTVSLKLGVEGANADVRTESGEKIELFDEKEEKK